MNDDYFGTLSPNLSEQQVTDRFVTPWLQGEPVVARGKQFDPTYQLEILAGPQISHRANEITTAMRTHLIDVTDHYINRPFGSARLKGASVESHETPDKAEDPKAVMVIHGRNASMRRAMFDFLRSIGLKPMEWGELIAKAAAGSPYIGQALDEAFTSAQAVVVLSTPDDIAFLSPALTPSGDANEEGKPQGQARPNVFLEAGMALAHSHERTILTQCGQVREASDLSGRHFIHLNNSPECRQALAERLKSAGCEIDTEGKTDWLSTGDFSIDTDLSVPNDQVPEDGLILRATALRDGLPEEGFAPWSLADLYNQLLSESAVEGLPMATQRPSDILNGSQPRFSTTTCVELRGLLGQLIVQRKLLETS